MIYRLKHCPQNPTLEYAESIIIPKKYTKIMSIGWGSTIDVGKWLARKYKLEHIAVPTTAGSGSEATKYCVLMVDWKKKTFVDEAFIPDFFKLDAELTLSLPRLYTVSSGLDALSHAFEAYWSNNATNESKAYSLIAIKIITRFLPIVLKTPDDLAARENMLFAANMAGKAINITKTNVCHAISYPLTEMYGIPHGLACWISLPYFANKFCEFELRGFIKKLWIRRYYPRNKIDVNAVARIVMQSEKLKDCPPIFINDITKSLCY